VKVYILSPHIDDAAYGLTLTISELINRNIPVVIINCFTVTKWTIKFVSKDMNEISLLRKQEDTEYNKFFNSKIDIINLELLDAPLRNNYIFQYKPFEANEWQVVAELKSYLEKNIDGILLCPLAIGNHIDHAICREAVAQLYPQLKVLFFEDLPYAARITEQEIIYHIKQIEERLHITLVNRVNGSQDCTVDKEKAIRVYRTQLSEEICAEIISHMNTISGERLWGEGPILKELPNQLI
jgi:LmbE family N-acetylglucosaminyl deacetylase